MLDSIKRIAGNSLMVLLALVLSVSSANANPFGGRHGREVSRPPGGQIQPQPPRDVQRVYSQTNERRETPVPQRLSPDERRQLRRDIQDAGREIYPVRR